MITQRCVACADRRAAANREARFGTEAKRRELIAQVAATADPVERLVRAIGQFAVVSEEIAYGYGRRGYRTGVIVGSGYLSSDLAAIESVCPGWNPGRTERGSWSDDEVARWFANYATSMGVPPSGSAPREQVLNRRGQPKFRRGVPVTRVVTDLPGWELPPEFLGEWMPEFGSPVKAPEPGFIDTSGRIAGALPAAALWYLAMVLQFPLKHDQVVELNL